MKFIKKLFKDKHYESNLKEKNSKLELIPEDIRSKENALREKTEVITVSNELKEFLNFQLLYIPEKLREIRKYDIEEIIDSINKKNEIRTNEIKIKSEIVDEFMTIIENIVEEGFSLGELEIEIVSKEFKIKEFVNKHKKLSYILRVKINSLKDLNENELDFLSSRYGIMYNYFGNEYHLDEILEMYKNVKGIVPREVKYNLDGAQKILEDIFKRFELYIPKQYEIGQKTLKLANGKTIETPNLKVVEDSMYYSKIENIFNVEKANKNGFRRICKETLKIAGFDVQDTLESFSDTIKKNDVIIDDIKYSIIVEEEGIHLEKY